MSKQHSVVACVALVQISCGGSFDPPVGVGPRLAESQALTPHPSYYGESTSAKLYPRLEATINEGQPNLRFTGLAVGGHDRLRGLVNLWNTHVRDVVGDNAVINATFRLHARSEVEGISLNPVEIWWHDEFVSWNCPQDSKPLDDRKQCHRGRDWTMRGRTQDAYDAHHTVLSRSEPTWERGMYLHTFDVTGWVRKTVHELPIDNNGWMLRLPPSHEEIVFFNDDDPKLAPRLQIHICLVSPEICDGFDNDCDGEIDEGYDQDGDGSNTCGCAWGGGCDDASSDCADDDPAVHPGHAELCDNKDNDCNRVTDDKDADGDGYLDIECGFDDCNDDASLINPGMTELCNNNYDDNCNGLVDEQENPDCNSCGWMGTPCDDNADCCWPWTCEAYRCELAG